MMITFRDVVMSWYLTVDCCTVTIENDIVYNQIEMETIIKHQRHVEMNEFE